MKFSLLIASNNQGKVREYKDILAPFFEEIFTLSQLGIDAQAQETGETLLENARIKALFYKDFSSCDFVLADDTGLFVPSLNGAPGVHSARFAGENATMESNRKKLLNLLVDTKDRRAYFETCVVLLNKNGEEYVSFGTTCGKILSQEQGTQGFGYDCIFYSDDLQKCFANATTTEKNSVSHRSRAIANLVAIMKKEERK